MLKDYPIRGVKQRYPSLRPLPLLLRTCRTTVPPILSFDAVHATTIRAAASCLGAYFLPLEPPEKTPKRLSKEKNIFRNGQQYVAKGRHASISKTARVRLNYEYMDLGTCATLKMVSMESG